MTRTKDSAINTNSINTNSINSINSINTNIHVQQASTPTASTMKGSAVIVASLAVTLCFTAQTNALMLDRRSAVQLQILQTLQLLDVPSASAATAPAQATALQSPSFPDVRITDRVFMDVRVARQDGSFYDRDDLPDTFENRVLKTRLTFGLYGDVAPNAVKQFLSYVTDPNMAPMDVIDNPMPSYSRSTFSSLDQEYGLLNGGYIPSLRVADVSGSSALKYGTRILPAKLWVDPRTHLSHTTKGLLTHRNLDLAPSFAITTRAAPALDATHGVFGQLIWTPETAQFLDLLQDLPTYKMERPRYDDTGVVATAVFNSQREVFRGVAKSFGDSRVDKLYEGKLLRRMEVTRVGIL